MPDITMNVDDTLELDTVIREDTSAKDPVEVTDGTDYNMNGIQTKTAIFDPQSSGDYTIKVNGQTISIKVNETNAIPDSVIAQYDATQLSLNDTDNVSTWPDLSDNGYDVTAGSAPTYVSNGINGNPSVDFDGNRLETSITTISQPITIITVVEQTSNSGDNRITSGGSEFFDMQIDVPKDRYRAFTSGDSSTAGGSPDGQPHVFSAIFDDSTGETDVRLDGSTITTGTSGSTDLTGITLGERQDDGDTLDGLLGIVEYHDGTPSNGISAREQHWADKFGITL